MKDVPSLPNGWEWQGGSRGKGYYTINFGTEYKMGGDLVGEHGLGGYCGHIMWDSGTKHTVHVEPIVEVEDNGDFVCGYQVDYAEFDSEQEALDAVPEMIERLKE